MSLLSTDAIDNIRESTVILDANAFVNGYSYPTEFSALLGELIGADCTLTTIEAVRIEFLSKNRSTQELAKKIDFYQETLTYPELPTITFGTELQEPSLLFAFGRQAHAFKAVDFMIAAAMKKYAAKVLLLTNDHHDFTPQLFDLKALLPFTPAVGGVVPFGLYGFSEEKYAVLLC
ncbi:MAG TPA: PIN domain-containing protein [Patescibacteria group bacterium]|nr:PIN domain-containing protein [Patescibacteria group bacterium]